ncbi:LytTR family DNA-binding domain-containing protein [Rhodoligotrophos defluvii]|uniref:LytTR family DNA-binding domain-containing protein n=1 Tax=Rhodoligotrophos defluvii TaxID=2561934 RepID=UPI0014859BF5|nr:LytTR family DNA-binding domain-containing protein [Rhodoligotrophos defluvii]
MEIEGWNGETLSVSWWARALSFGALAGVFLGIIGPFGTYPNPLALRVVHQCIIMLAGTVLAGSLIPLQLRLGLRMGLPRPFVLSVAIIATAAPIAFVAFSVSSWFWGNRVAGVRPDEWYSNALLILTTTLVLWFILETARRAWFAVPIEDPPPLAAAATARPFNGEVLCLQMEDNYVRVHRDNGSHLELMPLRDAIRKFGQPGGLQVHRSYWVAAGAVDAVERNGRNLCLHLKNGIIVPVARNRVAHLRAQAWIGNDSP